MEKVITMQCWRISELLKLKNKLYLVRLLLVEKGKSQKNQCRNITILFFFLKIKEIVPKLNSILKIRSKPRLYIEKRTHKNPYRAEIPYPAGETKNSRKYTHNVGNPRFWPKGRASTSPRIFLNSIFLLQKCLICSKIGRYCLIFLYTADQGFE